MPASHRPLAEYCLGYLQHSGIEFDGKEAPLVTAAFWDAGEHLSAAEPWDEMWEHGGHLLEKELLEDIEEALAAWQMNFGCMAPEFIDLARSLFRRKMARPGDAVFLEPAEVALLWEVAARDPESDEPGQIMKKLMKLGMAAFRDQGAVENFTAGCEALASIGIHLPGGYSV